MFFFKNRFTIAVSLLSSVVTIHFMFLKMIKKSLEKQISYDISSVLIVQI